MKNQIEIVKEIAEGMYGIDGIPSDEEFYVEFNMRLKEALGIGRDNRITEEELFEKVIERLQGEYQWIAESHSMHNLVIDTITETLSISEELKK